MDKNVREKRRAWEEILASLHKENAIIERLKISVNSGGKSVRGIREKSHILEIGVLWNLFKNSTKYL